MITAKALLDSFLVMAIFSYALITTGVLILVIGFRPKTRARVMSFSFGEFIVRTLYNFSRWAQSIAEGADSFLLMYREVQHNERDFICRAETERKSEEHMKSANFDIEEWSGDSSRVR